MAATSNGSRLRQVGDDREIPEAPAAESHAALSVLLLALKALSQRSLVALGNIALALSLASVWWLFNAALPSNPSVNQLIGLALYGGFVLASLWVRR